MSDKSNQNLLRMLPLCHKEAEKLDIIFACDGAASVGQVGHEVAVELTNYGENARMCCITAVATESKVHVDIAHRARKLIVINGCGNRCATKVLERLGIPYKHEFTIAKMGIEKVPTLDFKEEDVKRIVHEVATQTDVKLKSENS